MAYSGFCLILYVSGIVRAVRLSQALKASVNILTYLLQLKFLSYEELQQRMANLDAEMEREIDELRRRYQTKRQPILDAMDQKRKRQQNF